MINKMLKIIGIISLFGLVGLVIILCIFWLIKEIIKEIKLEIEWLKKQELDDDF